jgi:hypothetical protein
MFEVRNTGKTAVSFHNALHRVVELGPRTARKFAVEDLPAGVLRMFSNDKRIELLPEGDEATEKLKQALVRTKSVGFAMVHGAGDISEAHAHESANRLKVLDAKTPRSEQKRDVDKGRFVIDPANPDLQPPEQGEQPVTPATPAPETPATPPPEQSAATGPRADLLRDAPAMRERDFRRKAKELLGDKYPPGNVAREDVMAALAKAED